YCSVPGYGQTGPYVKSPAFDPLMQAQSGAMDAQGRDGHPPMFLRIAITDYAVAIVAASGIAAALVHKARTGEGQYLETSMVNAAVAIQAAEFMSYEGKPAPKRMGEMGVEATYRLYQANDGWLFLSCQDDESWGKAVQAMGKAELARQYPDVSSRQRHDAYIAQELEAVFAQASVSEWLKRLQAVGVRCSASRVMTDFHRDAWAVVSGLTVSADSPDAGPVKQLGAAIRFSDTPSVVWGPAPSHGQDTDAVLEGLGYSTDEIVSLRELGAVE
ncbi:MAG: CoA transferase, partial [Chloroflexi bacterium]|nr:CoA transferase [Chloroflexota bacterium]